MPLECSNGVLVEGGDKDDRRHAVALCSQRIDQLHAGHLWHMYIYQQNVIGGVANAADRFDGVGGHVYNLDI
jgi:hypothetical protein